MSTIYRIAPYNPTNWQSMSSKLKIEPDWYKERLEERWVGIKIFSNPKEDGLPLRWEYEDHYYMMWGSLSKDLQMVSINPIFEDFFLWHRVIIPAMYTLFLFSDSSNASLEMTSATTKKEIQAFLNS